MAPQALGVKSQTRPLDVSGEREAKPLTPRTDEELMLAYQHGDWVAFEELYNRYAKPIYNFFRRAGKPETAEDLVQKTFLKLHIFRGRYVAAGSFRGWIFVVARNVLRDEARRRARRPDPVEEFVDERTRWRAREEGAKEVGILVAEALAVLPLTQREVIVLNRYHGMNYAEIGEVLGISENAVKQRAFQAMRKLRRYLSDAEGKKSVP